MQAGVVMTHKSITDSAKGQMCTIRLPTICNFDHTTTVFAHISGIRLGHGTGIKTMFGAYSCNKCHDAIDGRARSGLGKDYLRAAHLDGAFETLCIILRNQPHLWEKFKNDN